MTNVVRAAYDPDDAPLSFIDRSVKVSTAAALLDCDDSFIRKLLKDGKLRGHGMGKRGIRIYLASIREYQQAEPIDSSKPRAATAPTRKKRASAQHKEAMAHLKALGVF